MSYKDTLNLPKTKFSMKANLPELEPSIIKFWEELNLYKDEILSLDYDGNGYILHDGPPYANGDIHIGHALNKVLKDIIVKIMTMRRQKTVFVPGWDCHGLPVEYALFKKLGKNKHDVDVIDFRKQAYDYAMKYVDIQKKEFQRLGVLGLWDKPYLTLDFRYEFIMLKALSDLVSKGYVYRGLKPVNWCSSCETALAEAEVEYETKISPSIYIKFPVANSEFKKETYLLVWTTTPWTLLGNVACAVNPKLFYINIENIDTGENYIIAEERLKELIGKSNIKYKVTNKFKTSDLEKLNVMHPFLDRTSRVISADFVSSEEGTGCVHIAPGHGEEDYEIGKKYNLSMYMPVDDKGRFITEYRNLNKDSDDDKVYSMPDELVGKHVFKANDLIIDILKSNNKLFYLEEISHSYPTCWRCKSPIIFRATKQWFMSVDHESLRKDILDVLNEVNWFPEKGRNRFEDMIKNRPDWCLSRQRLWGVPIPALTCSDCKKDIISKEIIDKIADLVLKYGSNVWFDKSVQELFPGFKCPFCGSENLKKLNDIIDVWFESGISHLSVLNKHKELSHPADLYLEGSDQHRGWFQTSMLTSMAILKEPPFKNILTHGFVVDAEGKKMSKSKGNVVSPIEVFKKYGADVLRLWVTSCDYTSDVRISDDILSNVAEAYKKIRNTIKFSLGNLYDFHLDEKVQYESLIEIDQWILLKAMKLVEDVDINYQKFSFYKIYRKIYDFCITDLSSFYFDILKDRLYIYKSDSIERKSAQTAIYYILTILVKLLAPIIPFTSEEVWRYLPEGIKSGHKESIHLEKFPEVKKEWINEALESKWQKLIDIREEILKALELARSSDLIGSSLEAKIVFYTDSKDVARFLEEFGYPLKYLFIVSVFELHKVDNLSEIKDYTMEFKNAKVKIEKAPGRKCQRCWNYSETVGQNEKFSDICSRCVKQII